MAIQPVNYLIRFLLEIIALMSVAIWGWKHGDGWLRYFLAAGFPIILAIIWGTFAVPNDPSRSGSAPIVTSGVIRLAIELGFFAFAAWSLSDIGWSKVSLIFGIVVLLHYVASYDRILWLLSQ